MIDCGVCACHGQGSTYATCSIPGGCGHLHRDEPSQRCHRQQRCADARSRTTHDENGDPHRTRVPAWAVTPGGLCRICEQFTHRAIGQLPADYAELSALLGKVTVLLESSTGGTRELLVPIRLNVEVLAGEILDELERWAEIVAADRGAWYVPSGTREDRLRVAAEQIIERFDRFLALPPIQQLRLDPTAECLSGKDGAVFSMESGLDAAERLMALHTQAQEVAGRGGRPQRLWAPCPDCGLLALEHQEGADHVDCRHCTHREPLGRYEKRASVLARAYGAA